MKIRHGTMYQQGWNDALLAAENVLRENLPGHWTSVELIRAKARRREGDQVREEDRMTMQGRWRLGKKLGRTLYKDDRCVGMVDTPELREELRESLARSVVPTGELRELVDRLERANRETRQHVDSFAMAVRTFGEHVDHLSRVVREMPRR